MALLKELSDLFDFSSIYKKKLNFMVSFFLKRDEKREMNDWRNEILKLERG